MPRPVSTLARIICLGPRWAGAWLLFGFFSIFGWVFAANADLSSWRHIGAFDVTAAEIVKQEDSGFEINDRMVNAFTFAYEVNEQRFTATSFATNGSNYSLRLQNIYQRSQKLRVSKDNASNP